MLSARLMCHGTLGVFAHAMTVHTSNVCTRMKPTCTRSSTGFKSGPDPAAAHTHGRIVGSVSTPRRFVATVRRMASAVLPPAAVVILMPVSTYAHRHTGTQAQSMSYWGLGGTHSRAHIILFLSGPIRDCIPATLCHASSDHAPGHVTHACIVCRHMQTVQRT